MTKAKITDKAYAEMVKELSPKTKSYKTIPLAFVFGGLVCTLGQCFINFYMYIGASKDNATLGASLTLIFLAALLTGLNVFDNIAKIGGAGTLVPITGFANAVAAPALEFRSEGIILGLGAKLFSIAAPVIVYGLGAGMVYGIVLYFLRLV